MYNKSVIRFFIIMLVLLILPINTYAVDISKAEPDELADDAISSLDEYYNIKPVVAPPENGYISSFEVADDGKIAVSYSEHTFFSIEANPNKCICVFDENGNFIYGYSFYCSGNAYTGWINSNASIMNVRASCIIEVSFECDIIGRYEYPVSDAVPVQQISGKTYSAEVITPRFSYDYAKIAVIEKDGSKKTIISISEKAEKHNRLFYLFSELLDIIILIGVPITVLIGVLRFIKKRRIRKQA